METKSFEKYEHIRQGAVIRCEVKQQAIVEIKNNGPGKEVTADKNVVYEVKIKYILDLVSMK